MEKTKVFKLNEKNKYVIKLSKGMSMIVTYPLITFIFGLLIYVLCYILNDVDNDLVNSIVNLVGNSLVPIYICIAIIIFQLVCGTYRFFKYIKVYNSILLKEEKNIMILYRRGNLDPKSNYRIQTGRMAMDRDSWLSDRLRKRFGISKNVIYLVGLILYLVGGRKAKVTKKPEVKEEHINYSIQEIQNDPRTEYTLYTDCKLIKETKKYYLFNGNNLDYAGKIKNKYFKISKIYSKMEQMVKDL